MLSVYDDVVISSRREQYIVAVDAVTGQAGRDHVVPVERNAGGGGRRHETDRLGRSGKSRTAAIVATAVVPIIAVTTPARRADQTFCFTCSSVFTPHPLAVGATACCEAHAIMEVGVPG